MSEDTLRERMVREQLESRDIHDPRVLDAMRRVPRHLFVPESFRDQAYEDHPLPIGDRQTISQPLIVATMCQLLDLRGGERVLEVGAGSGYNAAVLSDLCSEVFSIERNTSLAERARSLLEWLGYDRVHVVIGDGTLGYSVEAPYDGILVSAAAPHIPPALIDQLAPNGRLVIPVGERDTQSLLLLRKDANGGVTTTNYCDCAFVPLIGRDGWSEPVDDIPPDE